MTQDRLTLLGEMRPQTSLNAVWTAEEQELVRQRILTDRTAAAAGPGRRDIRRRLALVTTSVVGVVALGGVAAVAGLLPAGQVASPPLAPPLIVNGVGPAMVPVPDAPQGAKYLRLELACFDGTRCNTAGGGVEGGDGIKVQRDALPVTDQVDSTNPQTLDPLNPDEGVKIDVEAGTHWRLYAVYTDGLNPDPAPMDDGRTLGIPSNTVLPDLIPAVGTDGEPGWVEYDLLTYGADPELTADGVQQAPIPLYDTDGTTVIGRADVSLSHR